MQLFWVRTDEIRSKLEAGEIVVGAANRLQIRTGHEFEIAQAQAESAVTPRERDAPASRGYGTVVDRPPSRE
jgi:hypothetical protein